MEWFTLVFAFIGAALGCLTFYQNNKLRVKISLGGAYNDARGRNFPVKILNLSKFGITIDSLGFYYIRSCTQRKPLPSLYYRSLENRCRLEPRGTHELTMSFNHRLEDAPDVEQLQDIYLRTVCGKEYTKSIPDRDKGPSS